jgi:hypothetical protein
MAPTAFWKCSYASWLFLVMGAEMTEYIIPSKNLKSFQYQFLFLALLFLALVINVHVLDIGLMKLGGV